LFCLSDSATSLLQARFIDKLDLFRARLTKELRLCGMIRESNGKENVCWKRCIWGFAYLELKRVSDCQEVVVDLQGKSDQA